MYIHTNIYKTRTLGCTSTAARARALSLSVHTYIHTHIHTCRYEYIQIYTRPGPQDAPPPHQPRPSAPQLARPAPAETPPRTLPLPRSLSPRRTRGRAPPQGGAWPRDEEGPCPTRGGPLCAQGSGRTARQAPRSLAR